MTVVLFLLLPGWAFALAYYPEVALIGGGVHAAAAVIAAWVEAGDERWP